MVDPKPLINPLATYKSFKEIKYFVIQCPFLFIVMWIFLQIFWGHFLLNHWLGDLNYTHIFLESKVKGEREVSLDSKI